MAKIAFILLCHKDAPAIIAQAERLTATGDYVSIHFDARASTADFNAITAALADNAGVTFARRRIRCGWGEWSLCRATLLALEAAMSGFPKASHFYMLSGDCGAIRSAHYAHRFLDAHDVDYIEAFDFFNSDWIKTGFRGERLHYRHWFNERTRKRLFYASYNLQRRLGLRREPPADLRIMIGSQWWCLRRSTVAAILDFCRMRPDVRRFFRTTWIPDETFFQTLVRHLVPEPQIDCRTLTFKMFSDYGMPVTFYNDQYDLLTSQDYLFARKISPEATALKARLGALWNSDRLDFATSRDGPRLHAFLTGQGRVGKRFGQRFWERESTIGPDRELLVLVCKKWHVAKRLLHAVSAAHDMVGIEYVFDEEACPLPPMGGIEKRLEKRNRHRRSFLRLLFDYHRTDRMIICLDPANLAVLHDVMADRAGLHILELQCDFDDPYLLGHARRVGLADADTPAAVLGQMLPVLRRAFADEEAILREAGFPRHLRLREGRTGAENGAVLAEFLAMDLDRARALVDTDHLFAD